MREQETLWQIDVPHACFGVVVYDDRVIQAPPLAKWMIGQLWWLVCGWIRRKQGSCVVVR